MQRRDVNNQRQSQLLKYDYASQASELALTINVLGHVYKLSNYALISHNVLVIKSLGVSLFLFIYYIYKLGLISYLSKLIIMELQKLPMAHNNTMELL